MSRNVLSRQQLIKMGLVSYVRQEVAWIKDSWSNHVRPAIRQLLHASHDTISIFILRRLSSPHGCVFTHQTGSTLDSTPIVCKILLKHTVNLPSLFPSPNLKP